LDNKPGALPGKRHHPTPIEFSPEPLLKSIKKKENVLNIKKFEIENSSIIKIEDIENTFLGLFFLTPLSSSSTTGLKSTHPFPFDTHISSS
jgi:hypothetical protein